MQVLKAKANSTQRIDGVELPHTVMHDIAVLVIGSVVISFGLCLLRQGGIITVSTAGLAFLLHYRFDYNFGLCFALVNTPFYCLAAARLGSGFTLKTIAALCAVSWLTENLWPWITISAIHPLFAAFAGNISIGIGFLILFRHRASLGGVNILALYLQARFGLRAGYLQLAVDILILGCFFLPLHLPQWLFHYWEQ